MFSCFGFQPLMKSENVLGFGKKKSNTCDRDTGVATDNALITVFTCSFKGAFTYLFSHTSLWKSSLSALNETMDSSNGHMFTLLLYRNMPKLFKNV